MKDLLSHCEDYKFVKYVLNKDLYYIREIENNKIYTPFDFFSCYSEFIKGDEVLEKNGLFFIDDIIIPKEYVDAL